MITHVPHIRQPSWMLISSLLWKYGVRHSSSSGYENPCLVLMKTCDSTLSRVVSRGMSLAVTGDMSKYCIVSIMSAGTGTCLGAPPTGRRLRASAWGMLWPGLWTKWYSYVASINVQHCIRGDNICGAAFVSPNNPRSGLWSVTMVNLRPYKYWWNFSSPSITANPSLSICA